MTTQHIPSRSIELSPEGRKNRLADVVPATARFGNNFADFRVKEDFVVHIGRFCASGITDLTIFTIGSRICHTFSLGQDGMWSEGRASLVGNDGRPTAETVEGDAAPLTADRALILCDSHNRLQERDAVSLISNFCARAPIQQPSVDLTSATFSGESAAY
ncbi:MAG: hypothetical protein K1X83_04345 [Oligoflexia bacterium]|nr:hypothetical protein [Oligoflexia bacterium]